MNAATATDNCSAAGDITITYSPASGSAFEVGTTTVTATATDAAGNTDVCTYNVIVMDNEAPVITCPANITVSAIAGTCEATATFAATAVDNCDSDVAITYDIALGSTFSLGETTVTATATDDAGNTDVCTFTVTVTDDEAPTITCPTDVTASAATGTCAADVDFAATATDLCGGMVDIAYSQDPMTSFPVGTTEVTATATDDAGNTATCTFNVIVTDDELPMAVCQDIDVSLDANGMATIAAAQIDNGSTDNCGIANIEVSPSSFDCDDLGDQTVTLTVTDLSGNIGTCTATVSVADDTDPVFTSCAPDITVDYDMNCEALLADYTNDATAMDNCGNLTITQSPAPGTMLMSEMTTVTLTAADGTGNSIDCQFTVTLTPNEMCTSPDLTSSIFIDQQTFDTGVSRDFLVSIEEINGNTTDGSPVRFFVPDLSTFDITFSSSTTSADVFGGTLVNNSDWMMTAATGGTLFTYTGNGGVLPASSSSLIGFTVTRTATAQDGALANISVTIFGGDGGEDRLDNNQALIGIGATSN
jgi:hypothetical protein